MFKSCQFILPKEKSIKDDRKKIIYLKFLYHIYYIFILYLLIIFLITFLFRISCLLASMAIPFCCLLIVK